MITEMPSYKDEVRRKPHVVMEYNNTMGGVNRMDQHLTNYPITKKDGQGILQKNILPHFKYIILECFRFISETGREIISFEFQALDHLIERHDAVNERKVLPGILPNTLRLTEKHFLEVIALTDKKLRPTR
ncbi:piggyBac transposable element-derived protein 4 [Trichonephila clavipes]|nr:piggyBac transposable element-derived protein 4 [Trichonephila clavipes]